MDFRWNEWNVEHIAIHSVDPEEAEWVVQQAKQPFPIRYEQEKYLVWGRGRTIFVIHSRPLTEREKRQIQKASQEMKKKAQKPYWEMNTQELAAATAELDQEFVIDKCTTLAPEMRARWAKAKRKTNL